MTHCSATVNTHQDLVNLSDIFNNVRVDYETGLISFTDVFFLFGGSKTNKTYYKNKIKKYLVYKLNSNKSTIKVMVLI